eukprot:SAG31_NODE_20352_length_577_cov_0.644351_2_plen_41_part_01
MYSSSLLTRRCCLDLTGHGGFVASVVNLVDDVEDDDGSGAA